MLCKYALLMLCMPEAETWTMTAVMEQAFFLLHLPQDFGCNSPSGVCTELQCKICNMMACQCMTHVIIQ